MRAEITGGKITKNTRSNTRRPPLLSALVHFLSAHLYFILFYFAFSSQIRSAGLTPPAETQCFFYRLITQRLRGGRIEKGGERPPAWRGCLCALWAATLCLITKYASFRFRFSAGKEIRKTQNF